jgi:dipeptidyl aminopeptidase/acylaminoacyl peptidase
MEIRKLISIRKYTVGTVDASASNLRIKPLSHSSYVLAVTAQASPDGSLFNPEKQPKKHTTGKIYSSLFVRHWDTMVTSDKSSIWTGILDSSPSNNSSTGGKYKLSKLENALIGTGLESPITPFGGTDNFDIGPHGLVFVAKDPDLNPATHTKQNLYIAPRKDSSTFSLSKPEPVTLPGFNGATTSPVFSPDGKAVAFTSMVQDGYESDKNQLFVVQDIDKRNQIEYYFSTGDGTKGNWDRSIGGISWSKDGKTLYLVAEDNGRGAIFSLPSKFVTASSLPTKVYSGGSPSAVLPLENGKIFISGNSLVDNSFYALFDPHASSSALQIISSSSRNGSAFGLSRDQVDEIRYKGAQAEIHAWVFKPSHFKKREKYPLAYLIHGGPQGAWTDSW